MSGLSGRAEAEVGLIAPSAKGLKPGWLECDGSAISRTAYAALFNVIGETYGAGDGSTTFNLPDLRGEFPRGLDNGRGIDAGRVEGSWQADEFASHSHTINQGSDQTNASPTSRLDNATNSTINTINTSSVGGSETRPRNVAMMFLIKY